MELPTPEDMYRARLGKPIAIHEPRKRAKGRRLRTEAKVKKSVRAQCVDRDGECRLRDGDHDNVAGVALGQFDCRGPSQWCHMRAKRRSQTRGQAPEVRHTTADSFMGCQRHHDQYDGRAKPRLFIAKLTAKGADGPLKFRSAK